MYESLKKSLIELIEGETNFITNASNFSALLFANLKDINWCGFYLMDNGALKLGPFQGNPACINIGLGKGVCGTAAMNAKTINVDDVHDFPGHIACDAASRSEIVIPINYDGVLYGVLDIDSPVKARFKETDKMNLEELLLILINGSDIGHLKSYYRH